MVLYYVMTVVVEIRATDQEISLDYCLYCMIVCRQS